MLRRRTASSGCVRCYSDSHLSGHVMRHTSKICRRSAALAVGTLLLASVPGVLAARGQRPMPTLVAHAARSLNATDTAHLRFVRSSGSRLLDEGTASGTLPGRMRANVDVGATISGTFTLTIHGGKITGHGSATPRGAGEYESFSGSLVVTGGTGRYAHAHGHAGLYGTFDRNNYALVVQTTGTLHY
jgi:hypothetical protein